MDDIVELRAEAAATPVHGVWARGGPVFSHLSNETVHALEGRTIASFGDAATVGLWAFATGSLTAGLFQSELFPADKMVLLCPLLLAYSGPVLFIAGLFLFRRNNSFLGSSFCSFGAFNLTRGLLILCEARGWLPSGGIANSLQGVMMEVFAYIALSLFIGALHMNAVLSLMLVCTFVGFGLSGLPFLTDQMNEGLWVDLGKVGGYFMLAAGLFAFYGGSAVLLNTAWQRAVLPLGGQV